MPGQPGSLQAACTTPAGWGCRQFCRPCFTHLLIMCSGAGQWCCCCCSAVDLGHTLGRCLASLARFKELAPRLLDRLLMAAVVAQPAAVLEGYAGGQGVIAVRVLQLGCCYTVLCMPCACAWQPAAGSGCTGCALRHDWYVLVCSRRCRSLIAKGLIAHGLLAAQEVANVTVETCSARSKCPY